MFLFVLLNADSNRTTGVQCITIRFWLQTEDSMPINKHVIDWVGNEHKAVVGISKKSKGVNLCYFHSLSQTRSLSGRDVKWNLAGHVSWPAIISTPVVTTNSRNSNSAFCTILHYGTYQFYFLEFGKLELTGFLKHYCFLASLSIKIPVGIYLLKVDNRNMRTRSEICSKTFRPPILLKRGSTTQVFSCEYCKIFRNTYFEELLWTTASGATWNGFWPIWR